MSETKKIRAAVVGYGNIGHYAIQALEAAPDFEIAGVVRRDPSNVPYELRPYRVVASIKELEGVDVALLCTPTRLVEATAQEILALGISTVDSFDIHTMILPLREALGKTAREHGAVSVIAAGWDPGSDSVVRTLMEAIGRTVILEAKDFSAFIGLAGSSPALVCAFVDALARAGVMGGIPKALAVQIVAQAVLGTARTVQTEAQRTAEGGNGRTPADLIDAVCSPGGTSVAGMVALERAGFSDAVVRAFEAIAERDRQLGA